MNKYTDVSCIAQLAAHLFSTVELKKVIVDFVLNDNYHLISSKTSGHVFDIKLFSKQIEANTKFHH